MLAVGCCGYDDPEGLERLLKSCWRNVDLFFYIDGPYARYIPENPEYVKKETQYILQEYPNVVYESEYVIQESDKRQVYLDLCEEWCIDWMIVADTDEYFHPDCNWSTFTEERKKKCNDRDHLYNLKNYTEISYDGSTKKLVGLDQPRLIHWPSQIHYLNQHHYQFAINGTDDAIVAKETLYSVKLCHDAHLRTQERKDKHDEYIKWLKRYELEKQFNESPKEKENRELSIWSGN